MDDEPPSSPCTGVCEIDRVSQLCRGCLRSLDEIAAWPSATAAQQRVLLAQLEVRRHVTCPGT